MTDIMNAIYEMFSYSFIVRGIIVGGLVALCASVLGVILVLKRYSMIGDGLSHVGFGSMAVGLAFNFAPLKIAIPIVIISAFFLLRISENAKLKGDSAIALFSSSAVAIGVIVNALSKGTNIDLNSYMFGSILAVSKEDMFICISMGIVVILSFIIFYHNIFSVTFDEDFTRATGVNVSLYKSLLSVLTAITIVIGMRIMGTMLISSLIIFPALTSMRVFKRFKTVIISSVFVSLTCFFIGMIMSYIYEIPTGASIVVSNLIVFLLFTIFGIINKK
jgi:zinc transport system permease protein